MQDRPPRHKDVPDESLPERAADLPRGKQVRIELKGPLGCLAGAIMLAAAFVVLTVAAFAGMIAVAVAFWVGLGFVALAIVAALIRWRLR